MNHRISYLVFIFVFFALFSCFAPVYPVALNEKVLLLPDGNVELSFDFDYNFYKKFDCTIYKVAPDGKREPSPHKTLLKIEAPYQVAGLTPGSAYDFRFHFYHWYYRHHHFDSPFYRVSVPNK